MTYPLAQIYEEVAFIAYYFHWSHKEVMAMEHKERRKYCEQISSINKKLNDTPDNIFDVF